MHEISRFASATRKKDRGIITFHRVWDSHFPTREHPTSDTVPTNQEIRGSFQVRWSESEFPIEDLMSVFLFISSSGDL